MTENKSYYAIIPANVRYDERITPNAKLLYGEITALCNEKGYCRANNQYFANLYKKSKVSISKRINQLEKLGYISIEIIYVEGSKEVQYRYIKIGNSQDPIKENFNTPQRKVKDPIKENFNTPIKEKLKDNTTYINNTFNNTYNKYSEEKFLEKKEIKINPIMKAFFDKQKTKILGVANKLKDDQYMYKQQLDYEKLERVMKRHGYDTTLIPMILEYITEDDFRFDKIQSISKLLKKDKNDNPYWLVFVQKLKIEYDRKQSKVIGF